MEIPSKSFPSKSPEGLTLLGLGVNLGLVGLKVGLGLALGSTALLADGVHSLSDVATDFVTLGGLRLAKKPPDDTHAYGHGKFETLAGAVAALALFGVGAYLGSEAVRALRAGVLPRLGWAVALTAALSVLLKEWLYRVTARLGKELRSAALLANAWHHRSDALSSLPVFVGGICAHFGIGGADGASALFVVAFIAGAALRILRRTLYELTEGAFSPTEREKVVAAIEAVAGVQSWHKLRTRYSGQEAFVDVHIQVNPKLSVSDSHAIASQVEEAVRKVLGGRASVVVHIEPAEDED